MGVERASVAKGTRPVPTGCSPLTVIGVAGAVLALLCLVPAPAHPTNGLNMIAFGDESVAMGGADLAVAGGTSAMNNNPAGIARIPGSALDVYGAIAYPLSVAHRDRFGNDVEVSNRRIMIGGGGYTRRLGDGPVTVGIGFFAQGGAGNVYKNVATPFGTTDEMSSLFRIGKVTPSVAYRVGESVLLGASFHVVYADIRNPIPAKSLNPLLAAITEHHATFGAGYAFSPEWQMSGAVEYAFNNKVRYDNPELPFGPGAEEENESIAAHVMLSRRW